MSQLKKAHEDILERFLGKSKSKEQKFVDVATITGIITMVTDLFAQFCGGAGGSVPPRPEDVAERLKYPTVEDDTYHYQLARKASRTKITKRNNPTGERISGRECREMRDDYAARAFWAGKDAAAAKEISELTQYVIEARAAQ
jgi:hypothetical protein